MRKLLIILLMLMPMLVLGQVNQPGEVRAISYKYGVKGAPIEGVRVKARLTEARSGADGRFTVPVPRSKDNVFKFNSIVKVGYTAVSPSEQELRAKNYAVNAKSSVVVVMADPQTLSREKAAIEKKIWKSKEKQIAEREQKIEAQRAEIERLQTANKEVVELTAKVEKMEEELQSYKREFYSSGDRIAKEAERLAQIDYQTLDAEQARITDLLKEGKGDEVVRLSKEQITEELLSEITQDPGAMKREIEKRQALLNTTAQRLKNLADGYAVEYKSDSAAYYLKLRADMDTNNLEYLFEYGNYIFYLVRYKEALEVYNKGFDIAKKENNQVRIAECYNNIGQVYSNQGDYAKAMEYTEKSLEIYKLIYEENNNQDIANCYNNMGMVYYHQGDYAKALEFIEKSLRIYKLMYGDDDHPNMAGCYNNIGLVYWDQGDYAKAMEYYEKALDVLKKVYGNVNHLYIANTYNNIGSLYYRQVNYAKALEYYEKSLSIFKLISGENNPRVLTIINSIAEIYINQGDYNKALERYDKVLAINKVLNGENSIYTALTYYRIGGVLYKKGDYNKAVESYEEALSRYRIVYKGDNNIDIANSYNNMGMAYFHAGDNVKAMKCMQKSRELNLSLLGAESAEVAKNDEHIKEIEDKMNNQKLSNKR